MLLPLQCIPKWPNPPFQHHRLVTYQPRLIKSATTHILVNSTSTMTDLWLGQKWTHFNHDWLLAWAKGELFADLVSSELITDLAKSASLADLAKCESIADLATKENNPKSSNLGNTFQRLTFSFRQKLKRFQTKLNQQHSINQLATWQTLNLRSLIPQQGLFLAVKGGGEAGGALETTRKQQLQRKPAFPAVSRTWREISLIP